ncbi:aspartate--ammonia ligase [Mycoplasma sp. 128]|uniref:aspartate--ammonia ligase n=1 Tax=Mycoplasma sp. 3341 TaxID=3447506 RepID=UPI003F65902D
MNKLNIKETQFAIEKLKDIFSHNLRKELNLTRVSAPLFLAKNSGLNDTLNGEKAVAFFAKNFEYELEVVHSLAKWKRHALNRYDFHVGEGIYTDMNAIRREEILDSLHSFYVDQWDWEKVIGEDQYNIKYLKKVVETIYKCLKNTEKAINRLYPVLEQKLPKKITFITSQQLYSLYPNLDPGQREYEFIKKHKAAFISQIGYDLPDKQPHSKRAKDYDNWLLNGDIVVYDATNDQALELSSMGIRVDAESIQRQYQLSKEEIKAISPYHAKIIDKTLPLTVGGGIGQSRIAMFLLEKHHIGEVQVSVWDDETEAQAIMRKIPLL